eukprot:TRINITY_DN16516_c0_g1_i1.p1 TRINITY_DN16516_c0_g1~~TRINITY_DN16516_c0_g1_i1.p1  ORF type:complete len:326 (+),score=42.05 TRINITY_DN16516_c0_g1_i1:101-1078(+)
MVHFAPLRVPLRRRVQTACCLFICLLPFILISLNLIALFNAVLWPFYIAYLLWIIIADSKASRTGNRTSKWVRHWAVFKYFREYFPASVRVIEELNPNQTYLFAMHPHGIIGISVWANFLSDHPGTFSDVCKGITARFVTLKSNFKIPFFRELLLWLGLIDADRQTLLYQLNKKTSVLVMVGGAEEALYARPGSGELILKRRKGFVRIALETGAHLVPVYGFGENELYYQLSNPEGSRLRKFQEWFKKLTGVALPAFNGRGIMNYDYGMLPHRIPLITIIGKPIAVPKIENPTEEEVEKYHKIYIDNLKELYEQHRTSQEHLKLL